jgi:hypothetical protein
MNEWWDLAFGSLTAMLGALGPFALVFTLAQQSQRGTSHACHKKRQ